MNRFLLVVGFVLSITSSGWAQTVISGTVRDAGTGETLPSANIVIEGAYRGTITNANGSYSLTIPDSLLPATLQVRYIGYQSAERTITAGSNPTQDVNLQPSVGTLGEIVVSGEDPGRRIMRGVIEKKQQWRKRLQTYRAEAYTRQNVSSDTALVMVTESVSELYWDKQQGAKEIINWRKQTKNIPNSENFAGVRYLSNFYDDNIDIGGFDAVGITNPEALSFYDFKLVEEMLMDSARVYHLEVIPRRKLQPLFEGEAYVLAADSALLEVELEPNSVVRFPPPVQSSSFRYQQQFNNFGGDVWLPVDARVTGSIKIGVPGLHFPELHVRQLSRITNYEVNVPLPDTLFGANKQSVLISEDDSTAINRIETIDRVPLSAEEERAYAELDSSQTLDKAFQPSGFLARFVDFSIDNNEETNRESGRGEVGTADTGIELTSGLSPLVRYNRVDALFLGLKKTIQPRKGMGLSGNIGYSFGYEDLNYGGEISQRLPTSGIRSTVGVSYRARTMPRYQSQIMRPLYTSVPNLLGFEDYYDYFREEGVQVWGTFRGWGHNFGLDARFQIAEQRSLQTQTGYDILGRDRSPRMNPAIDEGRLHAVGITAGYNLDQSYPFGVVGRKRMAVHVKASDGAIGSDFTFVRYAAHLDWSFDTFYKRRLFANTLNISVDAGTFSGQLPLQEFGIIDVAPTNFFTPFEGLRTARSRPYEGEQYIGINVEHNFRTVPFERLGFTPLVERNVGVVLFAGAARTWVSEQRMEELFNRSGYIPHKTNGMHTEVGASLTGILDLFRVDFGVRLDEPGFMVGMGLTRYL